MQIICFRKEINSDSTKMVRIHEHNTLPFPPPGARVSIRDKIGDYTYYVKGMISGVIAMISVHFLK